MVKARNGIRHSAATREKAILLRSTGKTHREIVSELGISLGTAHLWLKEIYITALQKKAIETRRIRHTFNAKEKEEIIFRLRPFQFRKQYSETDLLDKIRQFQLENGRVPLKREFNDLRIYRSVFGSWNNAVIKAGFDPNPVLFAKKFIAQDGHMCDSFTEHIIDNWLHARGISHRRNVKYGNTKLSADFGLQDNILVEYFGLAGVQKEYDEIIRRKRALCKQYDLTLVEIYPHDMYPKNRLSSLLRRYI